MPTIRQAVIYSSAARFSMQFIGLVLTMLVSRLLTPDEIGTFAVASAVVMIMSEFRMLGAGGYLIRENELSVRKVRAALGLTILISWGLGGLILLLAVPVARFYDLPPLAGIFAILSVSFFIAPYISIPSSLYSRYMEFRIQFRIRLFATIVSFLSTIGFILFGFSYYSLALGQSLAALTQFLLMLRWRPAEMLYRPSIYGMGAVASFGVFNSLANLLRKGTVTVPDMIIGKLGTTAHVAMFSRGLGLIQFLSQTLMMGVNPVALPYLSETRRNGGDLADAYIKASVLLGAVVVPVVGVAGVASLPAIRLFFGMQWDEAAGIAFWLSIWGMFRCVHWFSNDVLMAKGHERIMAAKELIFFTLLVPGIILAYPRGLEWVGIVFVFVGFIEVLVNSVVLHRLIGLSVLTFFSSWWRNLVLTLVCVALTLGIGKVVDFDSPQYWLPILVIAVVLPPVWLACLYLLRHPLYREVADLLKRNHPDC